MIPREEWAGLYAAGYSSEEIGKAAGVGRGCVWNYLSRRGVAMRPPGPRVCKPKMLARLSVTYDVAEAALQRHVAARYQAGQTLRQIADALGISHSTVKRRLQEAGVHLRSRGTPRGRAGWRQEVPALRAQGMGTAVIAAHLGVSQWSVQEVLRTRRLRGEV